MAAPRATVAWKILNDYFRTLAGMLVPLFIGLDIKAEYEDF